MKKKILLLLSTLMIVGMIAGSTVLGSDYVANISSSKFHYVDCRWAKKISASHRVYYDTREDAIDDGYVPCKVCRP